MLWTINPPQLSTLMQVGSRTRHLFVRDDELRLVDTEPITGQQGCEFLLLDRQPCAVAERHGFWRLINLIDRSRANFEPAPAAQATVMRPQIRPILRGGQNRRKSIDKDRGMRSSC